MSFWSDASPVVKGVIVFGAVAALYLGIACIGGLPPFGGASDDQTTTQRGVAPQ